MYIDWPWLIVGLIPYSIKRHQAKDEQILTMKALFWRLQVRWKQGQRSEEITFPWIEHWQQ